MTLKADLAELLAEAGLVDVDVNEAAADEHVRSSAYRRVVAVAAESSDRSADRALVAKLARDPNGMTARTAVVDLIDRIASRSPDAASFSRWAAEILPETDRLGTPFIRHRVRDWQFWLSTREGRVPTEAELAEVTTWMQRRLAEESTSPALLALLAESGGTKKIRNIAKNRT
jgi:hypothetical protein